MWGGWVLVSICRWSRSVWIVGDMDGGRVSDMGTRKGNSHLYSTTGKRGEFFYFFFFFFFYIPSDLREKKASTKE